MSLMSENLLTDAIAILLIVATGVLIYFRQAYKHWKNLGVPYLEPKFPLGHVKTILPQGLSLGPYSKDFYDALKKEGHKFGGIYTVTTPVLVIVDPEYVRDILAKDFQYFTDRGVYVNEKDDPLSAHLFSLAGHKWKTMRVKLTPTFTSGKMKMMFETIIRCSEFVREALDRYVDKGDDVLIKEVACCFTTDVIGVCAFGLNCNSFKHPDAEFRKMGKRIFERSLWRNMKTFVTLNLPDLAHKLRLVRTEKVLSDFFMKVVEDTVNYREKNNRPQKDFLQLLIDMKNLKNIEESASENAEAKGILKQGITIPEITAQVFLFFIAGFETSSTTMTFALFELAQHQEIQEKLRREINSCLVKTEGKLTYESLSEMHYLDHVINETLRKYPPVPTLTRKCTQDYQLRDTNITLKKGTAVIVSVMGLHYDPEYYPNPEQFDPERFSEERKSKIHPYTHLPFGEGPRNCIGLRFGVMQTKIGLISVIKNFKLKLSPKTSLPLKLNQNAFLLATLGNIYLKVEKV